MGGVSAESSVKQLSGSRVRVGGVTWMAGEGFNLFCSPVMRRTRQSCFLSNTLPRLRSSTRDSIISVHLRNQIVDLKKVHNEMSER